MMDLNKSTRRGFLGALLGLAAAPVVAKLKFELPPQFEDVLVQKPIILPWQKGAGWIDGIVINGRAEAPRASLIRLARAGIDDGSSSWPSLLHLAINAAGGCLLWRPMPDDRIRYTPDFGIVLDVPADIQAQVYYYRDGEMTPRCASVRDGRLMSDTSW
jgi:hypothetical protein